MRPLASAMALTALGLLGLYVAMVIVNVFCRYVLGFSLGVVSDMGELILPSALVLTFVVAAVNGTHLSIRFLGGTLSPRLGPALDLLGRLALAGLFALFAWQMFRYAAATFGSGRTTRMIGIAIWPVWGFTSLALATAAVAALVSPLERDGGGDGTRRHD